MHFGAVHFYIFFEVILQDMIATSFHLRGLEGKSRDGDCSSPIALVGFRVI